MAQLKYALNLALKCSKCSWGYTNTFYAEILTCWFLKARSLKSEDILKQSNYPRAVKDRDTYIHTIAEKLTGI